MNHINQALQNYNGTDNYYKSFIGDIVYTDGAKAFADLADANWVIDDIAAVVKLEPKVKAGLFVEVKVVSKDNKATIIYQDGDDNTLYTQDYPLTDLLPGEYRFYVSNGVIYLPSEH